MLEPIFQNIGKPHPAARFLSAASFAPRGPRRFGYAGPSAMSWDLGSGQVKLEVRDSVPISDQVRLKIKATSINQVLHSAS